MERRAGWWEEEADRVQGGPPHESHRSKSVQGFPEECGSRKIQVSARSILLGKGGEVSISGRLARINSKSSRRI